jgi:hypothetical protein
MYKAALQSQWLDELVPLMAKTKTGMVIITREADDPNADATDQKYDTAWKIQGSKSLVYDASLVVRITRDGWVKETSAPDALILGERHRARIWKTKVGGKDDKHVDAYFHTSNGVDGHTGFDKARDVLQLALDFGIIEQRGAWYVHGENRWQGERKAVEGLRSGPLAEIEAEVRSRFDTVADG